MPDEITIEVDDVSKKFSLRLKHLMLYGVQDIARNIIGLSSNSGKLRDGEFWALENVSFEVRRGETVGLIGANGSGKSTILKMLNGIFMPDKGRVEIKGRVGALIEVGAGFHAMLTGRENIYVNGAILGMSKKEIDKKFDNIVDFADIGKFIDSPVKHYSSGMYVRLGFAIAVHCDPDILLIDEVLAVGDEHFQRKCMNKIKLLQEEGKTIVLVSHNLITVEGVCSRVVWIDKGLIRMDGVPDKVIDEYVSEVGKIIQIEDKKKGRRWGTLEAEIIDIGLFNSCQERINRIQSGEEADIIIEVKFNNQLKDPIFGIIIKNDKGTVAYGINSSWLHMDTGTFEKDQEAKVIFKQKIQLAGGYYQVDAAVAYSDGVTFCIWQERAFGFGVDLPIQSTGVANLDSIILIVKN